jgi:hypothetical protein
MPGGADWCVPSYLFFWMLETLERFQCSRQEGWAEVGFVSRVSREFVKKCQTSFAVKLLDDPTPASEILRRCGHCLQEQAKENTIPFSS